MVITVFMISPKMIVQIVYRLQKTYKKCQNYTINCSAVFGGYFIKFNMFIKIKNII